MFCGQLKKLYEALKAYSLNNHSTPVDTILRHCRRNFLINININININIPASYLGDFHFSFQTQETEFSFISSFCPGKCWIRLK